MLFLDPYCIRLEIKSKYSKDSSIEFYNCWQVTATTGYYERQQQQQRKNTCEEKLGRRLKNDV